MVIRHAKKFIFLSWYGVQSRVLAVGMIVGVLLTTSCKEVGLKDRVNSPRVLNADNQSISLDEDTSKEVILTAGAPNSQVKFEITKNPEHGTLQGEPPNLTYSPSQNYNGNDSFVFKVDDGASSSGAAISIVVNPVNDAPLALNGPVTVNEDTVASGNNLSAMDVDSTSLTFSIVSNATKGSAVITNSSTGAFTYTPNANANGNDSFTFKVRDGLLDSNVATVLVTINSVNDAPVAQSSPILVNSPIFSGNLSGRDEEIDTLTFSIVTNPIKGTATVTNSTTGTFTYVPFSSASGPDTFAFRVNDGNLNSNTATVSVTVVSALLTISGPMNFGSKLVGTSSDAVLTVRNVDLAPATEIKEGTPSLEADFSFKGGSFPGTGGTCSLILATGATCTLVVSFSPASATSFSSTLRISYFNGINSTASSVDLSGIGLAPASLVVTDGASNSFGDILVGKSASKSFIVRNVGQVTASGISVSKLPLTPFGFVGSSYPGTGGTCGTSIVAGGQCTLMLSFSPSVAGFTSNTFDFSFYNGLNIVTTSHSISGRGILPATLFISGGEVDDFGLVRKGTSVIHTYTVNNAGDISAMQIYGFKPDPAPLFPDKAFYYAGGYPGGGSCGSTLAPGATCTIRVTFRPEVERDFVGEILIAYKDGVGDRQVSKGVKGRGITPAQLRIVEGSSYDFGVQTVGYPVSKAFTVVNDGGYSAFGLSALPLTPTFIFRGGSFPGIGGNCMAILSDGSSCSIVVSFDPQNSGSNFNSTLTVNYNDGIQSRQIQLLLKGAAIKPAILDIGAATPIDFGNVAINSSSSKVVFVRNIGELTASSIGAGTPILAPPFSISGGAYPGIGGNCPTSIAPASSSCVVSLAFIPRSEGAFSDTFRLSYFDGRSTRVVSLEVRGNGIIPANLVLSDTSPYDFGERPVPSNTRKVFMLTNQGSYDASSISIMNPLTAPFSFVGGSYPGNGGTCGATILRSTSCTLAVEFAPSSDGAFSGSLLLNYFNGIMIGEVIVALRGIGLAPALLTILNGASYDFYSIKVGSIVDRKIIIENHPGALRATSISVDNSQLSNPFSYKGGSYPGLGGTCQTELASGQQCTIAISFSPQEEKNFSGAFNITYFDGNLTQSIPFLLSGNGTSRGCPNISFGAKGYIIAGYPGEEYARRVAIQPDGKIVVASTAVYANKDVLRRYECDSSLDPSFGQAGVSLTPIESDGGFSPIISQLEIHPSGKIVTISSRQSATTSFSKIRLYEQNGVLDETFGMEGLVSLDGVGHVSVLPNGKLLVLTQASPTSSYQLSRLEVNGILDTSFGVQGIVNQPFSNYVREKPLILPNGKIVVFGTWVGLDGFNCVFVQHLADGSLDQSFGTRGIVSLTIPRTHYGPDKIRLQSDGKYILSSSAYSSNGNSATLWRRMVDTATDNSFGISGMIDHKPVAAYSLGLDPGGNIIFTGEASNGWRQLLGGFGVMKVKSTGYLDKSFGTNGFTVVPLPSYPYYGEVKEIAIQADGKIILVGKLGSSTIVFRLNRDGSLDSVP